MGIGDESLFEFLSRRERELASRLVPAENAVAMLKAELEQVRKARVAAGFPPNNGNALSSGSLPIPPYLAPPQPGSTLSALAGLLGNPAPALPSIKQLIQTALEQNPEFRKRGASAAELRDFIRDAYGRDVERSSFSPQLSRLRQEGVVELSDGNWRRAGIASPHPRFHQDASND